MAPKKNGRKFCRTKSAIYFSFLLARPKFSVFFGIFFGYYHCFLIPLRFFKVQFFSKPFLPKTLPNVNISMSFWPRPPFFPSPIFSPPIIFGSKSPPARAPVACWKREHYAAKATPRSPGFNIAGSPTVDQTKKHAEPAIVQCTPPPI